jgi:hypothetical protein
MLNRHNVRGLKHAALFALVMLVAACDPGSTRPSSSPALSPAPNPAATQAGDLRTHLDLLLGEQVMIVAKQAVAAANHTDDYVSYTALLSNNTSELTGLWSRAFGNTTAARLADSWDTQNAYLVDYTIGVVTHDDAKSKAALSNLTQKFVPQFAQLVADASHLPLDPVTLLLAQQALENKAFVDDYGAQKYPQFYADLRRAHAQTSRFGDALSVEIANRFPDKFPGDPELRAVNVRVSANVLLQEHSYLATMATSAVSGGRNPEGTAAQAALHDSAVAASAVIAPTVGIDASQIVNQWEVEHDSLLRYAQGDSAARSPLTSNFVNDLASRANIAKALVLNHVNATLKVIDDQRSKNFSALANDDRAAATSTQPIADAIRG